MRNQLVYDLPMRAFHWAFAGLFITAFIIAKTVDDESPVFSYHMLAGILLVSTVILRVLWGFIGSRNSRFSSFALHPMELISYFTGILSGSKRTWAGHNPASSWATLAMLALSLGLGVSGFLMAKGYGEAFEDIHELMANAFLVVVLLHIAGVILHGFRHQDGIAFSMVDGRKAGVPETQAIARQHPAVAVFFVIFIVSFAGYLTRNFDGSTKSLKIFGTTLQLGESEDEGHDENDD